VYFYFVAVAAVVVVVVGASLQQGMVATLRDIGLVDESLLKIFQEVLMLYYCFLAVVLVSGL
jgi:hypothetical protein